MCIIKMVDISTDLKLLLSKAEKITEELKTGLDKQLKATTKLVKIKLKDIENNSK